MTGSALLAAGLAPGPAPAAPAASDEYILTLPGVAKTTVGNSAVTAEQGPAGEGVVGERTDSETTTAAIGSAMLSPSGLAVLAPALILLTFALARGRSRQGS